MTAPEEYADPNRTKAPDVAIPVVSWGWGINRLVESMGNVWLDVAVSSVSGQH
jgi:hypothetical protein